jgi:hypothetical protein
VPAPRTFLRSLASATAVAGLTLGGLLVAVPAAQALGAPDDLKSNVRNSSTVVLSWKAVGKAQSYEVQVDNSSAFTSPEFTTSTQNTKAVATSTLVPGKNYWRIRATGNGKTSGWANAGFTVLPVTTPIPLAPADGAVLAQPQSPPLLQWSSSQGAVSYTIEVDGDADLLGAKVYTTRTTSFVVTDPLTIGDWYWRVTATKDSGLTSLPSAVTRFDIDALPAPQITYPANDVTQAIEDVVLDWNPVPGARTYDVQVALDDDFNNIALSYTNVTSTRLSPPVTLNSDQFWWRVRAVDLGAQPTPWAESQFGFQRQWPDRPVAVYPTGPSTAPGTMYTTAKPYYQWTPVQHASSYELEVSSDINFTPGPATQFCATAGTTYTPRSASDCGWPSGGGTVYWRVRPIDGPYPVSTGLPGLYSFRQAFQWTKPAPPGGAWDNQAVVTGLKIAVDGSGIATGTAGTPSGGTGCTDALCVGVPTTPVLSWDPVPGAAYYAIYYAQDVNFTTTEIPSVPTTTNTMFALNLYDNKRALPESQAGSAYYWHVRPCQSPVSCGIDPESSDALPDTKAFRKASPAIAGATVSDPNASEITFSWQDYVDTNLATSWGGQPSNQAAKTYRIQVATDPSFGTITDTRTVDQTTYTAFDKLYPDGTYYWRVQAIDAQENGLTFSPVQSFTKASPAVVPSSPVGGALVSGTTPLRWNAQAFAASYTVEVYKNNDQTFSAANRIFQATVRTTSVAPTDPIPASNAPYIWRVRRADSAGNLGPWSATASFISSGTAPSPLTPKAGAKVRGTGAYFEWTEVPGAARYVLNLNGAADNKIATVATAYAAPSAFATGVYNWSVTALDAAGNPLGTSVARTVKIDSTAPVVKKVKPTPIKPTSTISIKFSEKVKGISKKSVVLVKVLTTGKF